MRVVKYDRHPVQIVEKRIPESDRDPHKYYYEMRHGDDPTYPLTIEYNVTVNFWGALVSDRRLIHQRFNQTHHDLNRYYQRQFAFGGND